MYFISNSLNTIVVHHLVKGIHQRRQRVLKLCCYSKRLLARLHRRRVGQILAGRQRFDRLQVLQALFGAFTWSKRFVLSKWTNISQLIRYNQFEINDNKKKAYNVFFLTKIMRIKLKTTSRFKTIKTTIDRILEHCNYEKQKPYSTICEARAITSWPDRSNFEYPLASNLLLPADVVFVELFHGTFGPDVALTAICWCS